jgi:hypothetical protein
VATGMDLVQSGNPFPLGQGQCSRALSSERLEIFWFTLSLDRGQLFKYNLDARLRGHDGVESCHSRGSGNPVLLFTKDNSVTFSYSK